VGKSLIPKPSFQELLKRLKPKIAKYIAARFRYRGFHYLALESTFAERLL
jgi:hypothetical protein